MKKNELNIPGLKHQPILFEMPEGYQEQLADKLVAMALAEKRKSEIKGKKIRMFLAVSSIAASALLAIWLIGSSYFNSIFITHTETSWTEEDEWVDAFSSGGEYEIAEEDLVDLTLSLIDEQEKESVIQSIESWFEEEGVEEEEIIEVLSS